MTGVIGKIAVLLGMGREGKTITTWKRKPGRVRRESDTITISSEARRLLACGGDEGAAEDDARMK